MKATKRYLAYLVVTSMAGRASGVMLREAIESEDSNAIIGATLIATGTFIATMYVGNHISAEMGEEVVEKIAEIQEKRRAKKELKNA